MTERTQGERHPCAPPKDEAGVNWPGARDSQGTPIWRCPECQRWWGYAWPGTGGRNEDLAWLPMRDMFTGHDPVEFDDLIDDERQRGGR